MAASGARGRPSPLSPPPQMLLEGTDGRDEFSRLQTFLRDADIYDFFNEIYFRLGIRRVNDLADMTEEDAEQIGMTRPQFTRLKRYLKKEKSIFRHVSTMYLKRLEQYGLFPAYLAPSLLTSQSRKPARYYPPPC